jgi:hypothetical protein
MAPYKFKKLKRPIYLVQECITTSAPNKIGFVSNGLANVLSTNVRTLFYFATLQTSSISQSFKVGFVGDSIQIIFVLPFMAFYKFSILLKSTKSNSTLNFSDKKCLKYPYTPPYTWNENFKKNIVATD